jgi:hypothetical protein
VVLKRPPLRVHVDLLALGHDDGGQVLAVDEVVEPSQGRGHGGAALAPLEPADAGNCLACCGRAASGEVG